MTANEYFLWLKRDWAKAGFVLSIFLGVVLFVFVRRQDFAVFLILLQTPLYMLHETEEYVFPGGFARFFNLDVLKVKTPDKPVDENFIFYVNIGLVWVLVPLFGLLSSVNLDLGLWVPYFSLFAGIAHIALALKVQKPYNPGLVISLLLNIPIGLWSIAYFTRQGILSNPWFNINLIIGFGINALLPVLGIILLKNYRKQLLSKG